MLLLPSGSVLNPSATLKHLKLLWHCHGSWSTYVGEQQSTAHRAEKEQARYMLQLILSSVRFPSRQGLALWGNGSDDSANITQLLCFRAEDKPEVLQWLDKSARKHIASENQNKSMAHAVLRKILEAVHGAPFLSVMDDETTEKSNKEQLTLVVRWISVLVSEEFLGLYTMSAIDAQSIVEVLRDAFLRFQIPSAKLHGQCYDGCSTMTGARAGLVVKLKNRVPCCVHTLLWACS